MDIKVLDWAVTQGLGLAIAVLVLFFYRRDVLAALSGWRDQTRILVKLVQDVTAALQANTDAIRAMERSLPHACPMADQLARQRDRIG
jgi:hypothetical protein